MFFCYFTWETSLDLLLLSTLEVSLALSSAILACSMKYIPLWGNLVSFSFWSIRKWTAWSRDLALFTFVSLAPSTEPANECLSDWRDPHSSLHLPRHSALPLFKETGQVWIFLSYIFKFTWLTPRGANEVEKSPGAISRKKAFLWSFASAHGVNNTLFSTHTVSFIPAGTLLISSLLFVFPQTDSKKEGLQWQN